MQEKTIQVESVPLKFIIEDDACKLNLAKSYTRVKDTRQLTLMTESANGFVPMKIEEEADQFVFTFFVDHHLKTWQEINEEGLVPLTKDSLNVEVTIDLVDSGIDKTKPTVE